MVKSIPAQASLITERHWSSHYCKWSYRSLVKCVEIVSMADVAVPTSEIDLPSLLTRHDNSQSTMGQAPETWVLPDFNIPILSSMIKLTFPLLTYIGWDYNFHFYSTEHQLNLSILRTARSWLFAVTFMFSIFYSKKK